MKKLFGAFICIALGTNILIGQSVECVTCKGNTIDPIKVSSAIGEKNTSNGISSFAGGRVSEASGDYSFAFGNMAKANALSAIAIGAESQSLGMYSVAIGRGSICNGGASMALGYMNVAQVESSYLFGQFLKSTSNGNVTIGMGAGTGSNYLVNNKPYSLMVGFNSTFPTLFVNSGVGSDKTGKVGIGNITAPTAKLHIKADNNEDASIKLEPTASSYYAKLIFGNNGHSISTRVNEDLKFTTQNGKNFSFNSGNIIQTTGYYILTDKIKGAGSNGLKLHDNGGNGINIENGGNVAIHTETYEGNLTIENSAGVWLSLKTTNSQNGSWYFENPSEQNELDLIYSYADDIEGGVIKTTILGINKAGRIGIAKTNPAYSLDVNGSINFSGDLKKNGQNLGNWLKNNNDIYFNGGNVGIGTSSSSAKLNIETTEGSGLIVKTLHANPWGYGVVSSVLNDDTKSYVVKKDNEDKFIVYGNGRTLIGNSNNSYGGYMLTVYGKIHAEEIKIEHPDSWFDYVFDKDYYLPTIAELETYIAENNHLPDVPTEKEVHENGINVAQMNGILLKKIEELTLYIIQQQKEIDYLKSRIE